MVSPVSPSAGVDEIAALIKEDHTRIRIGMVVVLFSALVFIPFGAVLTQIVTKVEGRVGVLTYTALLGAAGNMILTYYPAMTWLIGAYRPDRHPELIYLMNDAGWLQFVGGATVLLAMPISMARHFWPLHPRNRICCLVCLHFLPAKKRSHSRGWNRISVNRSPR